MDIESYSSQLPHPVLGLDVELVVSFLLLLQDVELSVLAHYLDVDDEELLIFIDYLQQKGIIEYEQNMNNITLLYHTLDFEFVDQDLAYEHLLILGFLKGRGVTTFKEIERITGLSNRDVILTLVGFIMKGYINDVSYSEEGFLAEISPLFRYYQATNLTREKRIIIGYMNLRVQTDFNQISLDLQIPLYPLVPTILKLLLSGIIDLTFEVSKPLFSEFRIKIYYKNSTAPNYSREPHLLSETERMVLGYASLEQRPKVSRIENLFNLSREEIIATLSLLTFERRYQFYLVGKDQIIPRDEFEFTNHIGLAELDSTSIFDYHALLGIIGISRKTKLSHIGNKLNIRSAEIYKRIIELYLQNLIIGSANGSVLELVPHLKKAKSEKLSTLTEPERILLGALISRGSLSWLDIRVLLNVEREVAIQRGYSILGKMGSYIKLSKDKEIILNHLPKIPPLLDSHSLPPKKKVVLGICKSQARVRISSISKSVKVSRRDAMNMIFYLIGSGLIVARQKRSGFKIIEVNIQPPILGINELSSELRSIFEYISSKSGFHCLRYLAWKFPQSVPKFTTNLFILVADGYLSFRKFFGFMHLTGAPEKIEVRKLCRNCGEELISLNTPCTNCLVRPNPCVICRVGLVKDNPIGQCPNCKVEGHFSHFTQWLQLKSSCPSCRENLSLKELHTQKDN